MAKTGTATEKPIPSRSWFFSHADAAINEAVPTATMHGK